MFYEGEHIFTMCVKAHLADIGDALPTTYMPNAIDVYAEGALIFPCVRIQEHYQDVPDIIRMCEKRIRVPEIWYGDYVAMIAAARVGEQGVKEFCAKFSLETVKTFVREWLDYSERLATAAIRRLPAGRLHASSTFDPFPYVPEGLDLQADIDVDPDAGHVTVDLRDNPDCVPQGSTSAAPPPRTAASPGSSWSSTPCRTCRLRSPTTPAPSAASMCCSARTASWASLSTPPPVPWPPAALPLTSRA